jgi:hypothetical protein
MAISYPCKGKDTELTLLTTGLPKYALRANKTVIEVQL